MNTNRQAPKCLIMQTGLIRADSQIPHSRQQPHRNVQQIGYTLQTQNYNIHSPTPPIHYFLSSVCVCAVKVERCLAAKYWKFPNNHTTVGDLVPKSRSMKLIITYPHIPPWTIRIKSQIVNVNKLHVSYHNTNQFVLICSAWKLVMRRGKRWKAVMTEALKNVQMNWNNRCRNIEGRWFDLDKTMAWIQGHTRTWLFTLTLQLKQWIWLNIYMGYIAHGFK